MLMRMNNVELIAELRVQAILAYGTDVSAGVLNDAADALEAADKSEKALIDLVHRQADLIEGLEAENEDSASALIYYSKLSEKLYDALYSVAPIAARAIMVKNA